MMTYPCKAGFSAVTIKEQRYHFAHKVLYGQNMVFPVVQMWELDHKEGWAPRNWCFQTVVLEKTPESPLDSKEIQPVHPKGNQPWIFIGRAETEAEAPILWPPDVKNWLIGKDLDPGKDWRQEEKGMTEDETVGWHHWLDGHAAVHRSQRVGHELSSELNWQWHRVCWGRRYLAIERSLNVLSGLLTSLQVFSLPLFLPCCAAPCFQLL